MLASQHRQYDRGARLMRDPQRKRPPPDRPASSERLAACSRAAPGLQRGPPCPTSRSDSFASLFEAETRGRSANKRARPPLGERCRAEVVQIGKDAVFVELLAEGLGKRAQAFLNLEDVRAPDGS